MRNHDYDKTKAVLRYWLLGRRYTDATRAMELGMKYHTGTRKDGVTPEFQHQISQALFAKTLEPSMLFPEKTLITVFLHDIVEDCNYPLEEIRKEFGEMVARSVELMTNAYADGTKKEKTTYYGEDMVNDPIASMAKGIDRVHNHQTMLGVFTIDKMKTYMEETEEYIVPMLKKASKRWPEQEAAYYNIISSLRIQMELLSGSMDMWCQKELLPYDVLSEQSRYLSSMTQNVVGLKIEIVPIGNIEVSIVAPMYNYNRMFLVLTKNEYPTRAVVDYMFGGAAINADIHNKQEFELYLKGIFHSNEMGKIISHILLLKKDGY